MRRHNRNRSVRLQRTALCAALMVAGGSAAAAPKETLLHSFAGGASDGAFPLAGLIADSRGNLYGTTLEGGASSVGTVFKLAPDGTNFKVLHSFAGGASDGDFPAAGLLADSSGNLFGTTEAGGASDDGVVFELSPGGTLTVLHSFAGGATDGADPLAGLIADSSGNLYGTTPDDGASGVGVVFKLSPDGTSYTVLHNFAGGASDGANPQAGLLANSSGNLFGTTENGGPSNGGVVFKLAGTGFTTHFCQRGLRRGPC